MRFKNFVWPQAPDSYREELSRLALFEKKEDGTTAFYGLGPVCKTIVGTGHFTGADAYANYMKLQDLMAEGTAGLLISGYLQEINVYFTGLTMKQGARYNEVAYEFTFREADAQGLIPDRSGGIQEIGESGLGSAYAGPGWGGVIVNP